MKLVIFIGLAALVACIYAQPPGWNNNNNRDWDRNNNRGGNNNNGWGNNNNNNRRSGNDIADKIFDNNRRNGGSGATCGQGWGYKTASWQRYTWTKGGIRPEYYENKGFKNRLEDCVRECDRDPFCYFATMTSSRTCYTLTTSNQAACRYMKGGHYGNMGEQCSNDRPCPSAYRVCGKPDCTLLSIQTNFCKNNDQDRAVSQCSPSI